MGLDIWVVDWKRIKSADQGDWEFLEVHFPNMDGSANEYIIDEEELEEVRKELSEEERETFKDLLATLKKTAKEEGGSFTLAVG